MLAEDVTEASYKKLIIALAKENNIPVWKIDKGEILGDWIGISKYLNKAKKVKSRKCSSLAVIDFAIDIGEGEKKLIEDKVKALWEMVYYIKKNKSYTLNVRILFLLILCLLYIGLITNKYNFIFTLQCSLIPHSFLYLSMHQPYNPQNKSDMMLLHQLMLA